VCPTGVDPRSQQLVNLKLGRKAFRLDAADGAKHETRFDALLDGLAHQSRRVESLFSDARRRTGKRRERRPTLNLAFLR
jgi:hypothetical protein